MGHLFTKNNLLAGSSLLAICLALVGCGSSSSSSDADDPISQVRIIHASQDAPPVNIRLDGAIAVVGLDYAESTGYVGVDSGSRDVVVEAIIPGGNADVISVNGLNLVEGERYNVVAVNDTAAIEALLVNESAAEPAAGEVAIAVLHASTAAALVDVYVTAPGVDLNTVMPNFSFDFKDVVDAGALPAGTYQIRVTGNGSKTPVYDSGSIDLSAFGGEKLLLSAISTINDTQQASSPIKLLVTTDTTQLSLLDTATVSGARVAHLSPDAGTLAGGPVEVFATLGAGAPVELIDAFEYTDIVPAANSFVGVTAGTYVFDVAPNTHTIIDSVFTSPPLELDAGAEYSVVAAGNVGGGPTFTLLATAEDNRPVVTQASVKVVHAAPLAGLVDVFVTPAGVFSTADIEAGLAGAPLLDGFAFAEITDYVAVAPGNYDIRVVPEATGITAINAENFALPAGLVATVVARQPDGDGTPSDFNLVVLTN